MLLLSAKSRHATEIRKQTNIRKQGKKINSLEFPKHKGIFVLQLTSALNQKHDNTQQTPYSYHFTHGRKVKFIPLWKNNAKMFFLSESTRSCLELLHMRMIALFSACACRAFTKHTLLPHLHLRRRWKVCLSTAVSKNQDKAEITLYPFSNKWSTLAGLTCLVKYLALTSKTEPGGFIRQTRTAVTERELMDGVIFLSGNIFKGEMKPLSRYLGKCRHKTPVTFSTCFFF